MLLTLPRLRLDTKRPMDHMPCDVSYTLMFNNAADVPTPCVPVKVSNSSPKSVADNPLTSIVTFTNSSYHLYRNLHRVGDKRKALERAGSAVGRKGGTPRARGAAMEVQALLQLFRQHAHKLYDPTSNPPGQREADEWFSAFALAPEAWPVLLQALSPQSQEQDPLVAFLASKILQASLEEGIRSGSEVICGRDTLCGVLTSILKEIRRH
jgi:hypothetical protein